MKYVYNCRCVEVLLRGKPSPNLCRAFQQIPTLSSDCCISSCLSADSDVSMRWMDWVPAKLASGSFKASYALTHLCIIAPKPGARGTDCEWSCRLQMIRIIHPSLLFPALAICIKLLLPPFVTEPNALVLNSVLCWPLTAVEIGLQKRRW